MNPIDSKNLERIADALTLQVLSENLIYATDSAEAKQRLQKKVIRRELREDE